MYDYYCCKILFFSPSFTLFYFDLLPQKQSEREERPDTEHGAHENLFEQESDKNLCLTTTTTTTRELVVYNTKVKATKKGTRKEKKTFEKVLKNYQISKFFC